MNPEVVEAFLKQLKTVATSPYAFVAYVVLVIAWAVAGIKTMRIKAISRSLHLIPEADRKSLLEKDYGFHLKEGMSATHFLKAQRASYIFYAFVAIVITILLISIVAILRTTPLVVDSKRSALHATINQIAESIENNFEMIKGPPSTEKVDEGQTAFESKISLPDSTYNYIEIESGGVPAFLSSLYHGTDATMAYRVYQDFIQEFRLATKDWIPHAGVLDKQRAVTDYVSFVKGKKKVVISLNRGTDNPDYLYVTAMFTKVAPEGDSNQ